MAAVDERLFLILFDWGQRSPVLGAVATVAARGASRVFSSLYLVGLMYLLIVGDDHLGLYILGPALSIALTLTFHRFVQRPRPGVGLPNLRLQKLDVRVRGASFPSKHSVSAFSIAGVIAVRWPALGVAVLVLAAVAAASRVIDGAHYPSDVAAGSVLGLGLVCLLSRVLIAASL